MIARPALIHKLLQFKDTEQLIKVLVGVRRCGKSTLLDLFIGQLLEMGVSQESILLINFEKFETQELLQASALNSFVEAYSFPPGKRYLFFDEVQEVQGWERVVNSLRLDPLNDIYITGSNMQMFDSNLAALLSGRYVEIEVFPLSFAEYAGAMPHDASQERGALFNRYLQTGGMPGLLNLMDAERIHDEYLDGVLSTIIMKDIVQRNGVRDVDGLNKLIAYLADNIGNQLTAKGISDYFISSGRRISKDTVDNYLMLLEKAHLFYRAKREDLRGKQIMKTNDKFYIVDLGFRRLLRAGNMTDLGRLLENAVYFELRRRGYQVSVGKHGSEEVDFVATRPDLGIEYYQVTTSLLDDSVAERELRPLRRITDAYPKAVLSLDEVRVPDYQGIRHLNIIDFLLEASNTQ